MSWPIPLTPNMLKQTAPQRSSNSLRFINNVTKQSTTATNALQGSNNPTTITFNNHSKHTQLYSKPHYPPSCQSFSHFNRLNRANILPQSSNNLPIIVTNNYTNTYWPGFCKESCIQVHFAMILRGRRPTHWRTLHLG